jgi:hypothetical protein
MLATSCSFCQYENVPGSRFCAKCGSPMHLKVCPNPRCGKVSDVGAAVCESCGQEVPRIAVATPGVEAAAESKSPESTPTATAETKSRMPAWPLVIMAIVAGGLPLLWANRTQLPTPKPWQGATPEPAKSAAATPPAATTPTPPAASAQTPPPAAVDVVAPAPPEPVKTATSSNAEPAPQVTTPTAAADDDAKSHARQRTTGKAAKRSSKRSSKKAEPPRPCTEAVAALGLCDHPEQAAK